MPVVLTAGTAVLRNGIKEILMRKIKYAIIGFSGFAENRLVREGFGLDRSRFSGHPQAELIGAAGRTAARREAAVRRGLKWYDSVDALMDDPHVEAVFIATNNLSHAPLAERALRAGKHCLIEKPITTTLPDAMRLQEIAQEQGLSLAVDHMMVENAYNRRAKELIAGGAIGQVNDLSLHMEFCYGSTPQEAAAWRCADPKEMGGPLGDVGSHCLYMAEFLLAGEITSLACVYTPRTLDLAVENGAIVQFRTHRGVQGTIRVAFNQPRGGMESTFTDLGYEVYGDQGILRGCGTLFQLSGHADEPIGVRLELDNFKRMETIRIDSVPNIYQAVISRHARSIIDQKPLDAADAVRNLRLVLACHESANQHGRWIEFR
jgi:predicted dehydrogenase